VRDLESINNPGEEMILQISRSPASTYLTVFQSSGVSLSPDLLMLSLTRRRAATAFEVKEVDLTESPSPDAG